jgi:colanic acid/amylovoran biosynthesis protein
MRTVTIGLLWHSVNSGNLGVGALTIGNIALIRQAASAVGVAPRFLILGFVDPGRAAYVTGPDIELVRLNTKAMLPGAAFGRAVSRCDLVIDIGGGDSFTDIYGLKRFAFLFWSKALVIGKRKPLVLAPQTIGPFTKPVQMRLAAWAMARASAVFCRDPISLQFAQALSPHAHLIQSVDVAFALPFKRPDPGQGRPRIGINVSGLLYNRGYDRTSSFGMEIDYPQYIDRLIEALSRRPDLEVTIIPHVLSDAVPVDDDRGVADLLVARHPWLNRAPDFADPSTAKSFIAGLNFLTGARMHACIAAYSAGVPVLPVAYSRKFTGLFDGVLGYPHLIPATGMTTDEAVSQTLAAMDRRSELASKLQDGRLAAERMLRDYVSELQELLAATGAAAQHEPA